MEYIYSYGLGATNITINGDIQNTTDNVYHSYVYSSAISVSHAYNEEAGDINVTVDGGHIKGAGVSYGIQVINNYADANIVVSNGATVVSEGASAISGVHAWRSYSNATKMNITLDGTEAPVTVSGGGGTAIDFGTKDDTLQISGDVNINGNVNADSGTDTLNIGTATINMGTNSSFSGFEAVNITGVMTLLAGKTVTIGSTTPLLVNNGSLQVAVIDADNYGKIVGTNGITFENGGTITIDASSIGTIANGTKLTNVFSGGPVEGLTSGVLLDNSLQYIFTSIINADSIDILVSTQANSLASFGSNGNSSAVGSALDAISNASLGDTALQTIISKIDNLSTDAKKDAALESLHPDISGATLQAVIDINNASIENIESHMELASYEAGGLGIATGDKINDTSIWAQAFGKRIDQDMRAGVEGYDASVGGFTIGTDKAIGDNARIGTAFSYSKTIAENSNNQEIINSKQLSIYSTYDLDKMYFEGIASGAINSVSGRRTLFDGSIASSSYDSNIFSAKGIAGYRTNYGLWKIVPFASLQYSYIENPEYTERGSSANLHIADADYQALESGLGIKFARLLSLNGYTINPHGSMAWYHDFINDVLVTESNFTSAPDVTFINRGASQASNSFKFGAGLDLLYTDTVTFSLDYNLEARENFTAHIGQFNGKVGF